MLQHNEVINIAIIDDHPIVIEGLEKLLETEPSFCVKARFPSGGAFMSYLKDNEVDIALLDITLPDGNGVFFCKEIRKKYPHVKILAISNLSERTIIRQMLQSGASGYLLKTAAAEEILACVLQAAQGELALSNEIKTILSHAEPDSNAEVPELTKREKQILQLLSEGKTSAEIAEALFVSPLTIKTHRATLLHKFNATNIVMLINRAKQYGML